MNTDGDDLTRKRKATARIVGLVGVVLVLIPLLGLRWMRAGHDIDAGVSLLFVEACGEDYDGNHRCESHSNLDLVDKYNDGMPDDKQILGTFAYAGIATIFFAVIGVGALGTAAVLAFKDKFIRTPVALTTCRAVIVPPEEVSSRHRCASSSKVAAVTVVRRRVRRRTSYLSTQCSA